MASANGWVFLRMLIKQISIETESSTTFVNFLCLHETIQNVSQGMSKVYEIRNSAKIEWKQGYNKENVFSTKEQRMNLVISRERLLQFP